MGGCIRLSPGSMEDIRSALSSQGGAIILADYSVPPYKERYAQVWFYLLAKPSVGPGPVVQEITNDPTLVYSRLLKLRPITDDDSRACPSARSGTDAIVSDDQPISRELGNGYLISAVRLPKIYTSFDRAYIQNECGFYVPVSIPELACSLFKTSKRKDKTLANLVLMQIRGDLGLGISTLIMEAANHINQYNKGKDKDLNRLSGGDIESIIKLVLLSMKNAYKP